jgi:cytochrome c-type biogenesis protein CcmH/NrfF
MRSVTSLLVGLLLLASPGPAAAQPDAPAVATGAAAAQTDAQEVANDVSDEVMSPYCPGVTLHDCPSKEASDMRSQIVEWARAGWTKDRIMDRLEAEFGPSIRATPPAEGAGVLAWLLPGLVLVAGAAVAVGLARRWSHRELAASPRTASASHEDRRRMQVELDDLRREA